MIFKYFNVKITFSSLLPINFSIGEDTFNPIKVKHGKISSLGYIFEKVAYISDCNGLSPENFNNLKKLKLLIIDCSTLKKHWSHFSFEEALKIIKKINPKKAILTNLSVWLDYNFLLNNVPKNVKPGYDGLKIRI